MLIGISFAVCPHCEYVVGECESIDHCGHRPSDGDLSVCVGCTKVSVFDFTRLTFLRKPTEEEHAWIEELPGIQEARDQIAQLGNET